MCVGQTSNGFIQRSSNTIGQCWLLWMDPKGLTDCRDLLFVDTTVSKGCKIPLSLFPSLALTECMCLTLVTASFGRIWTPVFYVFTVLRSIREDLTNTLLLSIDLETTHEASVFAGIIRDDDSVLLCDNFFILWFFILFIFFIFLSFECAANVSEIRCLYLRCLYLFSDVVQTFMEYCSVYYNKL